MSVMKAWFDWSCSVSVRIERGSLAEAESIVRSLMDEVDRAVSRFRDDSEIAKIQRRPGVMVPVNRLTVDLVQRAIEAARETDGAVDPTVGPQLVALGYDDDIARVQAAPRGTATGLGRLTSWRDVRVDPELRRVGVPTGTVLDLGSTAKAWTADEAARRVSQRVGTATLVEIGGDLSAAGRPAQPWQIDVSELRGGPASRVGLSSGGIATSSTAARRWDSADGTPVHHVVDPRTGRPISGPWRTVSVWATSAAAANVASTGALVHGGDAIDFLEGAGHAARLVGLDGRVEYVGPWPADRAVAS